MIKNETDRRLAILEQFVPAENVKIKKLNKQSFQVIHQCGCVLTEHLSGKPFVELCNEHKYLTPKTEIEE